MHENIIDLEDICDPDREINGQILWLQQRINEELLNVRILSSELDEIEGSLDEFLAEYCREVGPLFEKNKLIDKELSSKNLRLTEATEVAAEELVEDINFSYVEASKEKLVEKEIKRIYRKLAKICHPDSAKDDPYAGERFSMLSESYEEKDLSTLIGLEQALEEESRHENAIEKLERLEKQYDTIVNKNDNLKWKRFEVVNSPEYRLQQRVKWHRMCGENLIERIKSKIEKQITKKMLLLGEDAKEKISSIFYISEQKTGKLEYSS